MSPLISLDGLSIKHRPPQRTGLTGMFKLLLTNPSLMSIAGRGVITDGLCFHSQVYCQSWVKPLAWMRSISTSECGWARLTGMKYTHKYTDLYSNLKEDRRPYLQLALRTTIETETDESLLTALPSQSSCENQEYRGKHFNYDIKCSQKAVLGTGTVCSSLMSAFTTTTTTPASRLIGITISLIKLLLKKESRSHCQKESSS